VHSNIVLIEGKAQQCFRYKVARNNGGSAQNIACVLLRSNTREFFYFKQ